MQCRPELIERTYECLQGAPRAIVHFYNSTNPLQREVVFGLDKDGIVDIAVNAAKLCRKLEQTMGHTAIRYEYSPESFTLTEPEFAIEICEAVMDVVEPTPDKPVILNLPATVECYTPNVYGDVIEWFGRTIRNRDSVVISLHPHNDRGCGVAAAEFGVMAGADRVEGTLFGNGERTGNVDIVNLAMNLFANGVDPELDITDIDALRRVAEYCNRLPVPPRHPYAGDLVYTVVQRQPPGRDQEGLRGARPTDYDQWGVPYLPIDPKHVGRIVRGRHPGQLPVRQGRRGLRDEGRARLRPAPPAADRVLQDDPAHHRGLRHRDQPGRDVGRVPARVPAGGAATPARQPRAAHRLGDADARRSPPSWSSTAAPSPSTGEGNGPIDAFVHALRDGLGADLDVLDYAEHAIGARRPRPAPSPTSRPRSADGTCVGRRHRPEHHHRLAPRRPERPRAAPGPDRRRAWARDRAPVLRISRPPRGTGAESARRGARFAPKGRWRRRRADGATTSLAACSACSNG